MSNNNIDSYTINSAREFHKLTTSSRFPPKKKDSNTPPPYPPPAIKSCNNNNPFCNHCNQIIIPSPVSSLPIIDNPSISINDKWFIITNHKPILNSNEIENFESILNNNLTLPEMIFGNNKIEILLKLNSKINFHLIFNALDALKLVDLNPLNLIQVSYADKWFKNKIKNSNSNSNLEIFKPFDWTYTTFYKGTILNSIYNWNLDSNNLFQIPINKLTSNNPIKFFDEMILFEDELGDNGISVLNIKIRVMSNCLLILQRLFIRVDNVIVRILDTRYFIDFDDNLIIREFKFFENNYNDLLKKVKNLLDPKKLLRDINWCSKNLDLKSMQREYIKIDETI